MNDVLKRLKTSLEQATPEPDPILRAAHIAAAEKSFSASQGSATEMRPRVVASEKTRRGRTGGRSLLQRLTTRPALAGTASALAASVALLMVLPERGGFGPELMSGNDLLSELSPAEVAEESAASLGTVLDTETAQRDAAPDVRMLASPAPQTMAEAAAPLVRGLAPPDAPVVLPPPDNTEAFANADSNPLRITADDPVSTFSIDVDTASYAIVRSSLMAGQLPPSDAVRIEEMVNYFPYDYAAPEGNAPFAVNATVLPTPWNADTQLLHVAIQGELPAVAERPPLNLVFLVDTSGSMQAENKLPLLKQALRLMLSELRPEDEVAIVAYAGSAGQVLAPTPASEASVILGALDRLEAGGSTAGQEGLQQAYSVAEQMAAEGEIGRILLATDGDFNVGISDPSALEDYIERKRDTGVYLSVLGFGRGNLDDATMQALAQNGNGQAAYIDTLAEAQKVLVDQLTGALFPIASDVKIQIEFNPATVSEYRLIGYETRALAREDFSNDRVDAGDIGAGHAVTALYEITPAGSPGERNEPLRYSATRSLGAPAAEVENDELAFLRLRYKAPGEDTSTLIEQAVPRAAEAGNAEARFAAAIAGFGQLLRDPKYLGDWGWDDAIQVANETKGADPFGYRAEAVTLMRLAQTLSRE